MCLTPDETLSQYVSGVPSEVSGTGLGVRCLALNSQGASGAGSAQSPRFAWRDASSS